MTWIFQVYQLTLVIAFLVSGGVAVYAWQQRRETANKSFLVLLIGELIWISAAFLAVSHRGTPASVFYSKFWFPGVNLVIIGFFLLALEYAGRSEYITRRTLALLSIEPVVFNAILWIDESLVWDVGEPSAETMRGFVIEQGPAFIGHSLYSYVLLAAGTVMIGRLAFGSNPLYRRQATAILVAMSASTVANALYVLDIVAIDATPIGFAANGIVLGLSIQSVKLLNITPVARDSLVETIQDGVFVLDQDGRVVDINERGRQILGAESASGELGDDIHRYAADFVPVSELQSLHREPSETAIEVPIEDRYYTVQTSPLYGVRDEFVGSVFLLHDITEQRRRRDELATRNEQLDQFATVVSHDLRNPLDVATGYAELARETGEEAHFDRLDQALDRMEHLIDDLLTLARTNDQISERESTSLSTISRNAWNTVPTDGADLDIQDEAALWADPDRLQQLFENLFRNAVEHGGSVDNPSEHKGQPLAVTVGPLDGQGFFVEDDGCGIDPDLRDRILEPGVSTDEDGTGLGLTIVQTVVEGHGWTIEVTESEDGGARFEIRDVEFADE